MNVRQTNIGGLVNALSPICIKDDDKAKDLVLNGYIRECWRLSEFESMRYPPMYLIKIMAKYYLNQEIHLFD